MNKAILVILLAINNLKASSKKEAEIVFNNLTLF